jgi:nickel-dependent lactate racemase
LFPAFSDEATQQRFRAPTSVDTAAHQRLRRQEADEAAWLLGIRFTCQIVPGAGDSILHVLAGDVAAVAPRGRALCEAAWRYRVPQRTSLVVATLVGGPEQQTWENFARALAVAAAAVADGGEIVLCTSLRCAPGPALRHLSREDEEEHARTLRKIRRERSPDAAAAALLLEIRQRARVYLLSGLDGDTVDELGLGHVSEAGEINRLMRRHDSCLLLGDAQRAVVELVERTD